MASRAPEEPTRERLLSAGMGLFAQQGYRGTTVGQIEAAVGLQPRRGAMYKHFASKDALLAAAVERHLAEMETAAAQVNSIDISTIAGSSDDELRSLILALGQWFLGELDNQRELTHVLEHDGPRLSAVAGSVRERIVDLGYGAVANLIRGFGAAEVDADALAAVLLGSLAAARRTAWTFGAAPLEVDDERILHAWADTCLALRTALVERQPSARVRQPTARPHARK